MFLTITDDHDGAILLQRALGDNETIDPAAHARQFCADYDIPLDTGTGIVPLGCADFTVEIAEEPLTAVCWASQSFFFGDDR